MQKEQKNQSSADPSSYASRYQFDVWNGSVTPKSSGEEVPDVVRRIQLVKQDENTFSAYVPPLATGSMEFAPYNDVGMEWGDKLNEFAMWDSVISQQNPKYNILMSYRWWERDPVVYKCVDLLTKWANADIKFLSTDDNAKNLIEKWFEQAMPPSFREGVFMEMFRTGFAPVCKTLIQYVPRNYKPNKIPQTENGNVQATGSDEATEKILERDERRMKEVTDALQVLGEMRKRAVQGLCSQERIKHYEQQLAFKQATWIKGFLPGSYTMFSPLSVMIRGPREISWLREPYLQVDGQFAEAIRDPQNQRQKEFAAKLPIEIVEQIRNGVTEVRLPENICTILYGDKPDWEVYPTPICRHAFDALRMKYELRDMDIQTIRSIKNRILLVKVGNDKYPVFDPKELVAAKQAFNTASRTMVLFWNHTIELEWIEPIRDITDPQKYEGVNEEIRTCFGMVPMFLGNSQGSMSLGTGTLSFKGIEATVTAAQNKVLFDLIQKEVNLVRMALNISAEVTPQIDRLNLKEETQFMAVIVQMYMNGLIDHESALEVLGFDSKIVTANLEKLKVLRDKKGIFIPTPSSNNLGPESQNKPGGKGGISTGGKPSNSPGADNNKNKKGKSPTKKVKACLQIHDGQTFLVHEDELDTEEIDDVLSMLGSDDRDRIVTASTFKEKTGVDVDFIPPWPTLSTGETIMASNSANQILELASQAAGRSASERREDGKRIYVTAEKKAEILLEAINQAAASHVESIFGSKELPERWQRHFEAVHAALKRESPELPDANLRALSYTICTARANKARKE